MNIRIITVKEKIQELRTGIEKEKRYIEVAPSLCVEEGKKKIIEMEMELRRLLNE